MQATAPLMEGLAAVQSTGYVLKRFPQRFQEPFQLFLVRLEAIHLMAPLHDLLLQAFQDQRALLTLGLLGGFALPGFALQ